MDSLTALGLSLIPFVVPVTVALVLLELGDLILRWRARREWDKRRRRKHVRQMTLDELRGK